MSHCSDELGSFGKGEAEPAIELCYDHGLEVIGSVDRSGLILGLTFNFVYRNYITPIPIPSVSI